MQCELGTALWVIVMVPGNVGQAKSGILSAGIDMPSSPRVLSPADALDCAAWILSDVATRPASKSKHQLLGLRGKHICKTAPAGYCRGSDLKECIYVAFRVLERSGQRKKEACCQVAELATERLGKSRRGRPRIRGERDLFSKMKTVASMVKAFSQRASNAERLVNFRTDLFLLSKGAGIIRGSQYVENSGEKMNELWCDLVGAMPIKMLSGSADCD
jgi:hypothetical protein